MRLSLIITKIKFSKPDGNSSRIITQPMILPTSARLPFTSVPQTYELYRQKAKSEKRRRAKDGDGCEIADNFDLEARRSEADSLNPRAARGERLLGAGAR